MRLIGLFIFQIFSNIIALLIASNFITGFILQGNFLDLIKLSFFLTLINIFLRPILKLIFGPLILITFGLFTIVLNCFIIYLLDFLNENLIIEGYLPLILGTLIIGLINLIINFSSKIINK